MIHDTFHFGNHLEDVEEKYLRLRTVSVAAVQHRPPVSLKKKWGILAKGGI